MYFQKSENSKLLFFDVCILTKSLLLRKNRANIAETVRRANEPKKYILQLIPPYSISLRLLW